MTKKELRNNIKIVLKENISSLPELSDKICNQILSFDEYKKADTILSYMALPDEVDLSKVMKSAISEGKSIYLPKVDINSTIMEFYKVTDTDQTNTGAYGIQEPDENIPFSLKSGSNVLVLIPGRGFSSDGARLGRGKAYYDTYLTSLKGKVVMTGICFEIQLISGIPTEPHDVFMNYIISEKGIINTGK